MKNAVPNADINSSRQTDIVTTMTFIPNKNDMNSGSAERMQSTVPMRLNRVYLSENSFSLSFTIPVTPYSVSNVSFSRKA